MSERSKNRRLGQQIGNYRLTRLLGVGGFAEVYLGQHIYLDTQAAIKVLRIHLSEDSHRDFLTEARTIANLKHPHIVHVFECAVQNDTPYLVMDYAPNGSLRQRYPRGVRVAPDQIVSYVQQVASALQYAHQQKLIHRDIKPENMLLGPLGEVLLSDFGLALIAQSSGSQTTKEMAGTIPYMAPEQLQGKPRQASDQYALGVVVYEWLCGERPFTGTFVEVASQHIMASPPSLCKVVPGLSSTIEDVVFKALAKFPAERFESIQAFAEALADSVQDAPTILIAPQEGIQPVDMLSTIVAASDRVPTNGSILAEQVEMPPSISSQAMADQRKQSPSSGQRGSPFPSASSTLVLSGSVQTPSDTPTVFLPLSPIQSVTPVPDSTVSRSKIPPQISPALPAHARPKQGHNVLMIAAILCLFLLLVGGGGVAFLNSQNLFNNHPHTGQRGTPAPTSTPAPASTPASASTPLPFADSASITTTLDSQALNNTYTIQAVTGTPDTSQHQVQARWLAASTQPQSKTVNATGSGTTLGTHATGTVSFGNYDSSPVIVNAGSVLPNDYPTNIQMVLDTTIIIPASPDGMAAGIISTSAIHVAQVGTIGNIPQSDACANSMVFPCRDGSIGFYHAFVHTGGGWDVSNTQNFTGGQDPQPYTFVQQSDIDQASHVTLIAYPQPDVQQMIGGQIRPNERLIGTPSCNQPIVTFNHNANDRATTVTATVVYTCTGEAYDYDGALASTEQQLSDQAKSNPGDGYVLINTITTTFKGARITDSANGTVSVSVEATGIWSFRLSNAQKLAWATLIAGKKKSDAQTLLQRQKGIKQVDKLQLTGGNQDTLPNDASKISFVTSS